MKDRKSEERQEELKYDITFLIDPKGAMIRKTVAKIFGTGYSVVALPGEICNTQAIGIVTVPNDKVGVRLFGNVDYSEITEAVRIIEDLQEKLTGLEIIGDLGSNPLIDLMTGLTPH